MTRAFAGILGSFILLVALVAFGQAAQQPPGYRSTPTEVAPATSEGVELSSPGQAALPAEDHSTIEIVFSISVLGWGLLLIGGLTWVMIKSGQYWNGTYLRLSVLAIVVTAGLFVIVAGYTEQQIGPMMGLLGTLVGYLLGRGSDDRAPDKQIGAG